MYVDLTVLHVSAHIQSRQKVTNVAMDPKALIFEDVSSIYVTRDSVQLRAVLNKGMNIRFLTGEMSCTLERLLIFGEGICCSKLITCVWDLCMPLIPRNCIIFDI
jgi:hypothetical protein